MPDGKYYVVSSSVTLDVTFECESTSAFSSKLVDVKDKIVSEIQKQVGKDWKVEVLKIAVKKIDESGSRIVYEVFMRFRFEKLNPNAQPFYFSVAEEDVSVSGAVTIIVVLALILALVLAIPFALKRVLSVTPSPETPEGKSFWKAMGYTVLFIGVGVLLMGITKFMNLFGE